MQILFSPSSYKPGVASGFFTDDNPNLPDDCFEVSQSDHAKAINLSQGAIYSFSKSGALSVTPPNNDFFVAETQAAQIAAIELAYIAASTSPISYMNTQFQADSDSQDLISKVISTFGDALPDGFVWYDVNNVAVPVTHAQLQGLGIAIITRAQPLFINKQMKKSEIRNAKTVAAVNSITF